MEFKGIDLKLYIVAILLAIFISYVAIVKFFDEIEIIPFIVVISIAIMTTYIMFKPVWKVKDEPI